MVHLNYKQPQNSTFNISNITCIQDLATLPALIIHYSLFVIHFRTLTKVIGY